MSNICPKCGLPKEICVCGELQKTGEKITIETAKRAYGKTVTLLSGFKEDNSLVLKELKQRLACGGTMKNGVVELQGNHVSRVKKILVDLGYPETYVEK